MQKFQSVWLPIQVEEVLKMVGNNNKHAIWALLLSLLALITTFQQHVQMAVLYNLVIPNKIVLPWLPTKRPAGIFVWFVLSTRIFLEKAVYMVLRPSLC